MTIQPVLKKRNSRDNYGIINIRITNDRKSRYYSTKIRIPEKYWNPKRNEIRLNFDNSVELNEKILEYKNRLIEKVKRNDDILNKNTSSFLKYCDHHLKTLEFQKKFGTYKKYKTTLYHLQSFSTKKNKKDILFSDISFKWIEEFNNYLISKDLKTNSRNCYLKCCQSLFNKSTKDGTFQTYNNPFDEFKFHSGRVLKSHLNWGQVQNMIEKDFEFGSSLYETKNRFLIQIFAQGLRVSDLFTIKYNNILFDGGESRINFFQFKTKKRHSIQLSRDLTFLLMYYVDPDRVKNDFTARKFKFTWKEKSVEMTIPQLSTQLKSFKRNEKIFELFSYKVIDLLYSIYMEYIKKLRDFSQKNPNKFIVPCLKEEIFEGVVFDNETLLTKKQYNHLQTMTTLYNRELKELGKALNIGEKMTTHTPRHTYTNLMLEEGDVYVISKSLGHQRISNTESYLNDFDQVKVDYGTSDMFRRMNLSKIPLTNKEEKE